MEEKRDYYESDGIEVFDPLPDLRKACTYLEREIERLESDSYDE